MKIGFVSFLLSSIGMQEAILKEGHDLVIFIAGMYNQDLIDDSGLAEKYPGQVTVINGNKHYPLLDQLDKEYPIPPKELAQPILDDLDEFARVCDFIIFDYNGPWVTPHANYLRQLAEQDDLPIAGPTDFTNELELNRDFAKSIAEDYGFSTAVKHKWVKKKTEAADFLLANPGKNFLLKGTIETAMPLCREDCFDLIRHDPYKYFSNEGGVFLEEKIEGAELCFDTWFNGENYYSHFFVNREYKGAQNGTRGGIFTGESGTVGQMVKWDDIPPFIRGFFDKIKPDLVASGYKGFIGVNTITYIEGHMDNEVDLIKTKKVHFLEFTTRMGYPTEHILTHLVDYGSMQAWITGFSKEMPKPIEDPSVSIAYLFFWDNKTIKPLIHGIADLNPNIKVALFDAHYDKSGHPRVVEFDRALILTAIQRNFEEAHRFLMDEAHKVQIWGHTYRDDIGVEFPRIFYPLGMVNVIEDIFNGVDKV